MSGLEAVIEKSDNSCVHVLETHGNIHVSSENSKSNISEWANDSTLWFKILLHWSIPNLFQAIEIFMARNWTLPKADFEEYRLL